MSYDLETRFEGAGLVSGRRRAPQRQIATILFTDIVGSTDRAAQIGDRRWRSLREAHNGIVREELRRFGGHEVDTTGDGFLATFSKPAQAIRCAQSIVARLEPLDLQIRAGVHTGEIEVLRYDIAGIGVHIGARIAARAGTSEILVSSTTRDLMTGSGFAFDDRGVHQLKGVPGDWHLFAVEATPEDEASRDRRITPRLVGAAAVVVVGAVVGAVALLAGKHSSGTQGPCSPPATGTGAVEFITVETGDRQCALRSVPGLGDIAVAPSGDRIAFVAAEARSRQVYVWDTSGSRPRSITNGGNPAGVPTWSPDGSQIAFAKKSVAKRIYVVAADGGQPQTIGHDVVGSEPCWSSTGQIAFVQSSDGNSSIWVMGADGSHPHSIDPRGDHVDTEPAWSFDGSSIAFVRFGRMTSSIWVMGANGDHPDHVTPDGVHADHPAWSRDGSLAFERHLGDNSQIWIRRANGMLVPMTDGPRDGFPSWSPDGQRLYFVRLAGP
jgi:class 3 adenylate cyclase